MTLSEAIKAGESRLLPELLRRGVSVSDRDDKGRTVLHYAVYKAEDTISLLLASGADVNCRDNESITPLWISASAGKPIAARMLLEHGADPNAVAANLWSPLHIAAQQCNALKVTLGSGVSIDAPNPNCVEVVRLLIDAGADVHLVADDGATSLHKACSSGCLEVVELLLKAGSDIRVRANDGSSPLHCAVWSHVTIVERLLRAGADVNQRGGHDLTPLHLAASRGDRDVIQTLVAHGANPEAKDDRGLCPRDLAFQTYEGSVSSLPKEHLASIMKMLNAPL